MIVVFPLAPATLAVPLLLMVATVTSEDVHVTCVVRSMGKPELKVPTALNCTWLPTDPEAGLGVTLID